MMTVHVSFPGYVASGNLRRTAGLTAVAALVLFPLVASPLVVSTDGPSHVYNAFVQFSLRTDTRSPFAASYAVEPNPPAQGLFEPLVARLGSKLGWLAAERLIALLTVLLLFLSLAWLLRATRPVPLFLAGWFASNWFVAMGFYDFAISLVCFVLLLRILSEPPTPMRMLLANVALVGVWLAHSLTLCVSVAVFVAWWLWHLIRRTLGISSLFWVVPPSILAFEALAVSGVGGSGYSWVSPVRQLAGIVVSDYLVSFSPIDLAAGISVTTLLLYAAWRGARTGMFAGPAGMLAVVGIVLMCLSVVVPDAVGNGSYIGTRLRMLGALGLLPIVASWLARSRRAVRATSVLVLGGALAAHEVVVVKAAARTAGELDSLVTDLQALGAHAGDQIDAHLDDWEYEEFRVSGYLHLADRAALRMQLISLRNYEADLSIFPVRWRTRPLRPTYRTDGTILHVDVAASASEDPPPRVFVVHDCSRSVESEYPVRRRCTDRIGVSVIEPPSGQ